MEQQEYDFQCLRSRVTKYYNRIVKISINRFLSKTDLYTKRPLDVYQDFVDALNFKRKQLKVIK